jgi:hypothetical protein
VAAAEAVDQAIEAARDLRASLPSTAPLLEASARLAAADDAADDARDALRDSEVRRDEAERSHAEAVEASRRLASRLQLPHDRVGLDAVAASLAAIGPGCDLATHAIDTLARAVSRWSERGADWLAAVADRSRAERSLRDLEAEHDAAARRLATREDAIGLAYDEVVALIEISQRELGTASAALVEARDTQQDADRHVVRMQADHEQAQLLLAEADRRCVAELPRLRAALAVPGLLDAATSMPVDDESPTDPPVPPTVAETPDGVRQLAESIRSAVPAPEGAPIGAESVRQSLRQRRSALGAGWDAEDRQPDERLPLHIEVNGPVTQGPLSIAAAAVRRQQREMSGLLSAKQDQALRNLLQGLVAKEVADKLHAATELVARMNQRLDAITTTHGVGVTLRWRERDDLDPTLGATIALLAKPPDLRTFEEDQQLTAALSHRISEARRDDPELPYRDLIADVLDYRRWHRMVLLLRRPGRTNEALTKRTALSEGEKKMVSYLPLFAAVAASCDALAETAPDAPRFVLLDDAFAKVSEDNHAKLFGLLVELDLDFIATSERLWGTHSTVPELAITEVIRDAGLGVIVLEHSRWDGHVREPA